MIHRRFMIGSEWIYIKIYSGPKTLESIFIYDIMPLIYSLLSNQYIDSFFFIRYMDPNYHIRLRLHCPNVVDYNIVLNAIYKKLNHYVSDLIITKIQLDTYSRELERYNAKKNPDFEMMFHYDSCLIYEYLKRTNCDDIERYKFIMKFIDLIMDLCNYDINEKISFTENNSSSYFLEIFQANKDIKNLLNLKYRNDRTNINECFSPSNTNGWWHRLISKYVKLIYSASNNTLLNNRYLLTSIIHMHVNRMYRTNQRTVELVIYWYLYKYYKSKKAIESV